MEKHSNSVGEIETPLHSLGKTVDGVDKKGKLEVWRFQCPQGPLERVVHDDICRETAKTLTQIDYTARQCSFVDFIHEHVDEVLNKRLRSSDGFWGKEWGKHAFVCYSWFSLQNGNEIYAHVLIGVATGVFPIFGSDFVDPVAC